MRHRPKPSTRPTPATNASRSNRRSINQASPLNSLTMPDSSNRMASGLLPKSVPPDDATMPTEISLTA